MYYYYVNYVNHVSAAWPNGLMSSSAGDYQGCAKDCEVVGSNTPDEEAPCQRSSLRRHWRPPLDRKAAQSSLPTPFFAEQHAVYSADRSRGSLCTHANCVRRLGV